ncbi:MAG: hypothetical protein MUF54_23730, partial [Polyangiaceae bacterium]|nr:hypothetical protein [Polyangiaceae bacterium]
APWEVAVLAAVNGGDRIIEIGETPVNRALPDAGQELARGCEPRASSLQPHSESPMRAYTLNNTALDLQSQNVPFNPGSTIVALNLTAGSLTVQEADDSAFTSPATVATIATNIATEITPTKRYLRVSTAANVTLLGN